MISLPKLFIRQVRRESLLQIREISSSLNAALFFLMLIVFFPLTLPANISILRVVTPGLIWIAILFSLFLSSERLFKQDYDDGVIEQWLVSSYPISILVLAKISVHWFMNILPMLLISPILSLLLGLSFFETGIIITSLVLGSPAIVALCAMSAAFSCGLKNKGVVMALILMPLTIPILILGSASITQSMHQQPVMGFLALLLAISCISVSLLPFAIAGILKISLVD